MHIVRYFGASCQAFPSWLADKSEQLYKEIRVKFTRTLRQHCKKVKATFLEFGAKLSPSVSIFRQLRLLVAEKADKHEIS